MNEPALPRPVDPFVSHNAFRSRQYKSQNIPSFAEASSRLPIPVLPDRPEWLEMYWRAWEIAWSKLRRPRPQSGFVSNFMESAVPGRLFMWNSAFVAQYGLYGRRAFNFMGSLDNFYAKQHDDGFIGRDLEIEQGHEVYSPFDPNSTGPNILAWSEWRYFRLTGDDSRVAAVFWPLIALHRWYRQNRTWPNGLYWATGQSSGLGNQPRVPNGEYHHCHWTWVDANLQAALNCQALGQMAVMMGEVGLAEELAQERTHLQRETNSHLWNEALSFYQDMDPHGRFSEVKSIAAYWALLDKEMVPVERLQPFLRPLRDTAAFRRPHRVPTMSADSPGYDPVSGDYWRGGVWSPTNFMLLKGLRAHGQHSLAHEIAVNHLHNICAVYQHTDTFWENYAPETETAGSPAQPDYVDWTGLSPIAILLEDVIGISVDWPQRRVVWDRRFQSQDVQSQGPQTEGLQTEHPQREGLRSSEGEGRRTGEGEGRRTGEGEGLRTGEGLQEGEGLQKGEGPQGHGMYGIRNYPLGPDGTMDLVGNGQKIIITTNVPITLTIQDEEENRQTAVPAGTTEIDLTG
jgi:hypothetical protein